MFQWRQSQARRRRRVLPRNSAIARQSPARVVHLLRRLRRSEPKRTRGGGVGTWRGGRVLRAMVAPRSASRVPKERFFLQNQSGVEHQTAKLFMSVNLSVSCFFVVGRFRRNALICSPSLDDLFQSYPRTRTLKPVVYARVEVVDPWVEAHPHPRPTAARPRPNHLSWWTRRTNVCRTTSSLKPLEKPH